MPAFPEDIRSTSLIIMENMYERKTIHKKKPSKVPKRYFNYVTE